MNLGEIMKNLIIPFLVLAMISCATQVERRYSTPSNSPEVTVNASKEEITNYLLSALIDIGYSVTDQSTNNLELERNLQGNEEFLVDMTIGNAYSNNKRISKFTFIDTSKGVRVIWKQFYEANMIFGQTNEVEITNNQVFNQIMDFLYDMKIDLEL